MSHHLCLVSKQRTPADVLQSLATITGQRDRNLLARTLVSTLTELIHSNRITMYRILPGERGDEAILVAWQATRQLESSEGCEVPTPLAGREDHLLWVGLT